MTTDHATVTAEEKTVRDFMSSWHVDQPKAYEHYLSKDCVWEQPGMPTANGKAECLAILEAWQAASPRSQGDHLFRLVIRNVAVRGAVVIVERADEVIDESGQVVISFPCVGVFVVRNGFVCEWRDYYDASPHRDLIERAVEHWTNRAHR